MEIRVRTDNHLLTATLKGQVAEKILTGMIPHTSIKKAKEPGTKIFVMEEDYGFSITNDVKIMLFKGYYLVVS